MWHSVGILDQRNYSFCQQGFPSFEVYLITLYLSHVSLRLLSFPLCADWPNSDSQDSREPRGVLGAAFKFLRHRCKLSPLSPSRPPPSRAVRVKGGKSLRNGMWKDVRNGIIMQNKNCGMT